MRRVIPIILILALLGGGTYWWSQQQKAQAAAGLTGSGTIEAQQINIGPEVAGRVVEVLADEGQTVKAGQVLFRLDDSMLKAQRVQVNAAVQAARAQRDQLLASARPEQLQAAQADVNSAQAALAGAQADLGQLLSGATGAQIAAAQAQLEAAQAQAKIIQDSYNTVTNGRDLCHEHHIGCGGLSQVTGQVQVQLNSANQQVAAAQAALNQLLSGPTSPEIRSAQARVAAAQGQLQAAQDQYNLLAAGPSREQVAAADAAVAQAEETLRGLDVQADKLVIRAPTDGTILARNVEPGEVVGPGSTVFVLGQLGTLQLTVYLPEDAYGQVKLGQAARATVDSYPGVTFPASVVHIADQAEFTPRSVQTVEGRRTTVYAIKLDVPNPDSRLKPGMPADVTFNESNTLTVK
jgi:multidrug resistance efflux pump